MFINIMSTEDFACASDASTRGVDTDESATSRFVYTAEERELLRCLVNRYRGILENKKTNNASKEAKSKAWERLAADYNSQPNVRPRSVKQLKKCWDNEKSRWKKKDSEERRDIYATGEEAFSNFKRITKPFPHLSVFRTTLHRAVCNELLHKTMAHNESGHGVP